MANKAFDRGRVFAFVHQFLERLTSSKLRVGLLRHRLRRGALDPVEAEAQLAHIEEDVDTAAALAHDLRREAAMPA